MTRNPTFFGFFFGRAPKRSSSRSSRSSSSSRRPPAAPKAPKAPKPARPPLGAASAKIKAQRSRQKRIPRIYSDRYMREVLAGKHGAEALRLLLRDARTVKKNPGALGGGLAAAQRASRTFHGAGAGDVLELSAAERRRYGLPRFVVPIGRENAIEYVAPDGSQRGGAVWRHRAGDRGRGVASARSVPMLVADPRTGRVETIGGQQRFDPRRGLIG